MSDITTQTPKTKSNKFIVYKASGGFVHMISGIFYCINVAKKMNRTLLINTIAHSAFAQKFGDYFDIIDNNINYSEEIDIIPSEYLNSNTYNIIKNPVRFKTHNVYIDCCGNTIPINIDINNQEKICFFCGVKHSYLFLPNIIKVNNKIMNNLSKIKIPKDFISIHFRNTDKKNDITKYIKKVNNIINEKKIKNVYLATDNYKAYNNFKLNLDKTINLIQYTIPFNNNGKNIHYGNPKKDEVVYNTLLDMYMILHSNYFIPSYNSGFSKFLIRMIEHNDNIFNIVTKTQIVKF